MFGKSDLGTVLAVAALLIGIAAYAVGASQIVKFETLVIDAGSVREGQDVRATFRFRNHGASTATIVNIAPACGGAASVVSERIVRPGQDGKIDVLIHTLRHQGPLTARLTVTLADPLERAVLLTVNALVEREFIVESPMVDFGKTARETAAQRELTIRLNKTEHRVVSVRSTDESFTAHVEPQSSDGITTVVIRVRPQSQLGLKFGTIRIITSSPHMPELIVPVRTVLS